MHADVSRLSPSEVRCAYIECALIMRKGSKNYPMYGEICEELRNAADYVDAMIQHQEAVSNALDRTETRRSGTRRSGCSSVNSRTLSVR